MHRPDVHDFDETSDVADAALELIAEIEDLLGAPEAQMIGREHMIALRQRGNVELPGDFGGAAELGGVKQQNRGADAAMRVARLQIMRPHPVDADVFARDHSAATAPRGRVRGRSLICG